jgi:hypothetical protein
MHTCVVRGTLNGPGSLTDPPCGKPSVAPFKFCAEHEAEALVLRQRARERDSKAKDKRREALDKAIAQRGKSSKH